MRPQKSAPPGWKELMRYTYEDEFPVGSSEKLAFANVDLADVIAGEPFVAPAAALSLLSVNCRGELSRRLKTT